MTRFKIAALAAALAGAPMAAAPALAQDVMTAPSRPSPHFGRPGLGRGNGWNVHRGRWGNWRGRHHRNRGGYPYGQGIDFYLDVGSLSTEEPRRDLFGFFGTGGTVRRTRSGVHYDYDRSYPYDWYEGAPVAAPYQQAVRETRCEVQMVSNSRGGQAPVRICRN